MQDDEGNALPGATIAAGINGDCSGGVSPWGTIFSAEENVQGLFGEIEDCWTSRNVFTVGVCAPGSNITWDVSPSGAFSQATDFRGQRPRDHYGYAVEIDPLADETSEYYGRDELGVGHMKLGAMGRARWENFTFAVNPAGNLASGQPVVIYGGNDRRGGRNAAGRGHHPARAHRHRGPCETANPDQIRHCLRRGPVPEGAAKARDGCDQTGDAV